MDKFSELVKECRNGHKNHVIHNASKSHAMVLFRNLIEEAKACSEPVRIATGTLDNEFYKDLKNTAVEAMNSGVRIKVLVMGRDADVAANEFAQAINESTCGELILLPSGSSIEGPHFIVVGENKYRLEIDHPQSKAVANFNDLDVGQHLVRVFHTLVDISSNRTEISQ